MKVPVQINNVFSSGESKGLLTGWAPLTLVLLSLVVYANSFPGSFILDDFHIVVSNPLVQNFEALKIFRSDYWYGIENSGLYRPITVLSLALNQALTGSASWGFHLVNVLLHGGVTVLIWVVLPDLGLSKRGAFIAAALFAVHPLHAEVVNVAVGRSELLVALFLLLALLVSRKKGAFAASMVLVLFALAQFSKEHAAVFLAILPLCDAYSKKSWQVWRRRWPLYGGVFLIIAGWLLLREFVVVHHGARSNYDELSVPLAYLPWDQRVLTALLYQGIYLIKQLTAWNLQVTYSQADLPAIVQRIFSLRGGIVLLGTCGVLWSTLRGIWRWQLWALLAGCYILTISPTSNIFLPIGVTFADRLAYFPSVWFCAEVGLIADICLFRTRYRTGMICLVACMLAAFSTQAWKRNNYYQSELKYWAAEVENNPEDYLASYSFAETLFRANRFEEAENIYKAVLAQHPEFSGVIRSYVGFLEARNRFSEALAPALNVLALSRKRSDPTGIAYDIDTVGEIYLELGEPDKALEILLSPGAGVLEGKDFHYVVLGRAYAARGNYKQAVESFRQVESFEGDAKFALYYGLSLLMVGDLDAARGKLQEATRLNPSGEAWNMIGTIEARQNHYLAAAKAFATAVELSPDNQFYKQNLERLRKMGGTMPLE